MKGKGRQSGASATTVFHLLFVLVMAALCANPALAQVTSPTTLNGTYPVGTTNLGGSTNGTANPASLTGLGSNQGVTFDFNGTITNVPSTAAPTWNSGVWFTNSTTLAAQTVNAMSPDGDFGTYTLTFSKTVYGLRFRIDGIDFYDSMVITAYDAAGAVVPLTTSANVAGLGTELAVSQQGSSLFVSETDGTTTAGQLYLDFTSSLSTGIKSIVFSRVAKNRTNYAANVTVTYTNFGWDVQKDYSDAPSSYGTATHRLLAGMRLGTAIDVDTAALASAAADGDDANATDDEDGVSALSAIPVNATSYTISASAIAATGTGKLHAWIDFNRNGAFQSTEYATVNVVGGVLSGNLVFTGLPAMTVGTTFVRFRFTSDAAITSATPSGVAIDGEVEDYSLQILPAADLVVTKTNAVTSVNAGSTTSYTVTVTNNGPSSVTGAILTDAVAAGLTKTAIACSGTPGQCTAGTTPTVAQLESGYALPTLASGQTYQIIVNATVTATSGSVANGAAIAAPSGTVDPTTSNNTVTDTDTVTPVAELVITKTNGVTSLISGSTTTYTVTVTNNGPSSVTGALIQDVPASGLTCLPANPVTITGSGVPAGSFTISNLTGTGIALGTLANGQTATLTYSCKVN